MISFKDCKFTPKESLEQEPRVLQALRWILSKALAFGAFIAVSPWSLNLGRQGRELRAWKQTQGAVGTADAFSPLLVIPAAVESDTTKPRRAQPPCCLAQRPRQSHLPAAAASVAAEQLSSLLPWRPSGPSWEAAVTPPAFFRRGSQGRPAQRRPSPSEALLTPVCTAANRPSSYGAAARRPRGGQPDRTAGLIARLPTLHPAGSRASPCAGTRHLLRCSLGG